MIVNHVDKHKYYVAIRSSHHIMQFTTVLQITSNFFWKFYQKHKLPEVTDYVATIFKLK